MISGLVISYIWAAVIFVVGIILMVCGFIFMKHARRYKKMQEELVKKVEIRTKKEYNKIALMSPKDLNTYLTQTFAKMLEVESQAHISEKDFEATTKLFAYSLAALVDFLGPETIDAIDYYYGKDYVQRWAQYSYRLIEARRLTDSVVNKAMIYESLTNHMV